MHHLLATLALLAGGSGAPIAPPTFLLLSPTVTATTPAGKTVTPQSLNLRVFRMVEAAKSETVFDVEGVGRVTVKGVFPKDLWPVVQKDTELEQVRRQYTGKTVYLRMGVAGGGLPCSGNGVSLDLGDGGKGLKVLNIYRLNRPYDVETRGFNGGGPYQKTAQAYAVIFAGKAGLAVNSIGGADSKKAVELYRHGCTRLSNVYADPVMLSRFLSLTPPPKVKGTRGKLVGKTAEEALWLAGVPDLTPGTPAQLLRLGEWRYSNLPGLGDGVIRFQNGRVVSGNWPRLP